MLFLPLWRSGQSEPSPGAVTQVGVGTLQQAGVSDVTQFGVATVQQAPSTTAVTQVGGAGLQARNRTRVTQIAAILIYVNVPPPPPELDVPCLTAPPVIASEECAQPNLAPLTCPTTVSGTSWRDTNGTRVVPSIGLNESDVQP